MEIRDGIITTSVHSHVPFKPSVLFPNYVYYPLEGNKILLQVAWGVKSKAKMAW